MITKDESRGSALEVPHLVGQGSGDRQQSQQEGQNYRRGKFPGVEERHSLQSERKPKGGKENHS